MGAWQTDGDEADETMAMAMSSSWEPQQELSHQGSGGLTAQQFVCSYVTCSNATTSPNVVDHLRMLTISCGPPAPPLPFRPGFRAAPRMRAGEGEGAGSLVSAEGADRLTAVRHSP